MPDVMSREICLVLRVQDRSASQIKLLRVEEDGVLMELHVGQTGRGIYSERSAFSRALIGRWKLQERRQFSPSQIISNDSAAGCLMGRLFELTPRVCLNGGLQRGLGERSFGIDD
jgi:hypothetical protein